MIEKHGKIFLSKSRSADFIGEPKAYLVYNYFPSYPNYWEFFQYKSFISTKLSLKAGHEIEIESYIIYLWKLRSVVSLVTYSPLMLFNLEIK